MGEIAVLQPQDFLENRYPRQNYLNYSAMKSRRKPRSDGSKPTANRRRKSPTVTSPPSKPNLVMGQVKILKRGEALTEINKNTQANYQTPGVQNLKAEELDDFVLSSTQRLGPEPEILTKKVGLADFYAGSGVIDSPAPSCLPVPGFFVKKVDPTSEIRRMLRLDLQ